MDPKKEKMPQIESVDPAKPTAPPVQPEEKKEPIHQVPEKSVAKPKKVIVLYPTVILLILVSVVAGYLGYQNYQLKRQFKDQVVQVPQPTETPQETPMPTTDPAADWEIYTNNDLGLSFKYPSDYIATKTAQTIKNKNTEIVKLDTPNGVETNSPIVSLGGTTTDLSIEDFIENENDCPDDFDSCTPLKEGPIADSIQFEAINRNYGSIDTLFKKEGIIYRFSISAREGNSTFTEEQKTLYNQILSTFKFITNEINREEAVKKVAELPEVKEYLSNYPNTSIVDESPPDESYWLIHVFETVSHPGEVPHAATYGWYKVDKKTGTTTKQ